VLDSAAEVMTYLILNWLLSTTGLLVLAALLPGFRVTSFPAALIAVGVVGLLHASVSTVFRPAAGQTGISAPAILLAVADTLVFRVVALLVPGFAMTGLYPALAGAVLLLALNLAMPRLTREREKTKDSAVESLLRS
jgi:putative membrane protein